MSEIKVGGEVDAFCTRCKMILAHTVLAIWAGQIKQVRCNTCMGQHGFRRGQPGTTSPKPARPSAPSRPKPAAEPETPSNYSELLSGKDRAGARRYDVKEKFTVGELVQHPTFGLGVVAAARGLEKIDVVFPAAVKTLLHCRGAAPALARPLPQKAPDVELPEEPAGADDAADDDDEPEDEPITG